LTDQIHYAPGWPGIEPRWTSSAKTGVGTALTRHSRVWFTLSHGILDEVYFPRVDQACTRDFGLIVTNGRDFFSEEKRHCIFQNRPIEPGVPAYELINMCGQGYYRIYKEVLADPYRNVVLQKIRFVPLQGRLADYRLYALIAPHLANAGYGNTAWVGEYKGVPLLFAQRDLPSLALAVGCSAGWLKRSAGFVGASDGWRDLSQHFQLTWDYNRAENGNVALTGEIDLSACNGEFVLALGFGGIWAEAGQQALSSLLTPYEEARQQYVFNWHDWHKHLKPLDTPPRERDLYRTSVAVLRTHESKDLLGGIIASLSIPWGFNKGDEDLGGYHLIWPRDLVENAGGLLAAGAHDDALRVLHYLESTQEADGYWPQNMWLDGRPYWGGLQMDETAFPILLIDLMRRESSRCYGSCERWWPLVRKAATFIVCNGPVTQQDRWEEDGGYSTFTLAVEVSALLAAADLAERIGADVSSEFLREIADTWNDNIERWTYATNTDLARQVGVEGYYVRVASDDGDGAASPLQGFVPIKNRPFEHGEAHAAEVVSPDALALVRFGLRAPDDPRMLNTIKVVDALLRVKLPQGPCWYRYNGDGYGEHEDGSPFDGTGVGRPWPLLSGERAHYELAAGRPKCAEALLAVIENATGDARLIPEQVWDGNDIPERELFLGKASGSACPLVWAHSEYIKLRRSLADGKVFDQPAQTTKRYLVEKKTAEFFNWRFNNKARTMPCGKKLRLLTLGPALVHWSFDAWQNSQNSNSKDSGWNLHYTDLPTAALTPGREIVFTFMWKDSGRWEDRDFTVSVE
jgi:glucoamylase